MNKDEQSWSEENLGSPMDGQAGLDYPNYDEYQDDETYDNERAEWLADYAEYCNEYSEENIPF